MQSLSDTNKRYSGLFGKAVEQSGNDNNGSSKKFAERWGWYVTLDRLSNSRPDKWKYYYDMGVIEFLNLVAFYKDKDRMERMKNKK